jgi:hypothetical protein
VLKCNAHHNQSDNSKWRKQIEKANAHLRKKEKGMIYKRLWPTCKNHNTTDPNPSRAEAATIQKRKRSQNLNSTLPRRKVRKERRENLKKFKK